MGYPNNWLKKKTKTFQSVSKFPFLSFILTQYEHFLKWEVPPNHPFHWRFFFNHPDPYASIGDPLPISIRFSVEFQYVGDLPIYLGKF